MSEPIVVALIAAVGGAVGGLVVAIVGPLMQDFVARRAEDRAGTRDNVSTRRARIERMGALLAGTNPTGDYTSTAEAGYRELRTVAAAIDDSALTEHIGRMHSSDRGSRPWLDAYGDARHRTGELLSQL